MTQRIMVVDDDSNLRLALKYRFECEEYDVEVASDGAEALEKAGAEQPDLIILDLAMPNMDGLEFLDRLRGDPVRMSVPVIILTAVGLDPYRGDAEDLDFADLIVKPFKTRRLLSAVERALGSSHRGGPAGKPSERQGNSPKEPSRP